MPGPAFVFDRFDGVIEDVTDSVALAKILFVPRVRHHALRPSTPPVSLGSWSMEADDRDPSSRRRWRRRILRGINNGPARTSCASPSKARRNRAGLVFHDGGKVLMDSDVAIFPLRSRTSNVFFVPWSINSGRHGILIVRARKLDVDPPMNP